MIRVMKKSWIGHDRLELCMIRPDLMISARTNLGDNLPWEWPPSI